jgi:hypothetical protein
MTALGSRGAPRIILRKGQSHAVAIGKTGRI